MHAKISENLARVRARICDAAASCHRPEDSIELVAVTKYVEPDIAKLVVDAGCFSLGESRPQELWRKAGEITEPSVAWHLIGHLQRNKVRKTLPLVTLFHGCDSRRLLDELEQEAARQQRTVPLLLEINISGDSAKHGFAPHELDRLIGDLATFSHLQIRGLMTMAALAGGEQAARENFASLRMLRDRVSKNCPDGVSLDELSMGMSRDFESAIKEGATMIRVGSAIFQDD